jgi:hypothetical protein
MKPTNAKNFSKRIIRFASYVQENPEEHVFELFDSLIEKLHNNDYFGTEGQNHPFGDMR